MKSIEINDLRGVLRAAFPTATLPEICDDLKAGDIPEWDSLGNFSLLLAVEESYNVRFTTDQVAELKSIEQIYQAIQDMTV